MYTAYIGKRLIEAINKTSPKIYTPRSFFDEIYYPLFFANPKFFFDSNVAPPGQALRNQKRVPLTPAVIDEQRIKIHNKIANGDVGMDIYLGGPSSDRMATTSGQITAIHREIPAEDVYASWIGTGLGALVEGGLSLLIDDDEALLTLYEGWTKYREYLDKTETLKPHQINTWNGQWLAHRWGRSYQPEVNHTWSMDKEKTALTTQTWVHLLFALSHNYRKTPDKMLTAYIYSFGQTNRTLGFVRLNLPEVFNLADLYNELFPSPDGMRVSLFEDLYKTEFGFKRACQAVTVGKRALQPKDMREFIEGKKTPAYTEGDAAKTLYFQTQETWIIAMLNNKELITKAEALAEAMREAAQDSRGKMVNTRRTEEVLSSKSRREFIEGLTTVIQSGDGTNNELFNEAVEEVINMPTENVPLFLTLVRFKYAYLNRKPSKPATQTDQPTLQEDNE